MEGDNRPDEQVIKETLQSIDGTLKRIEKSIPGQINPKSFVFRPSNRNANDLIEEYAQKCKSERVLPGLDFCIF